MSMVRAACHCTSIRFNVKKPERVLDCNCTICRRYGALWIYPEVDEVELIQGVDATDTYIWGDRELAFHRCKECGCVTHYRTFHQEPPRIHAVNARMIPTLNPAEVQLVQKDNGHSGFFWSHSSLPVEPSLHSKINPPKSDNWQ